MNALTGRWQRRHQHWSQRQRHRRERQIVSALARHGLGLTLSGTAMGWILPFQWGLLGHPRRDTSYSGPEHLRMAFEDLGPTFIKLAQILSTRGDLVGPTYASELARLQSSVPALPFTDIAGVIESELGAPLDELFTHIDEEPIGSGSIGQVHRATLPSGESVVIKVQKPGVRSTIELDLDILRRWVVRDHTSPQPNAYDMSGFLDEFGFTLTTELDYLNEAENASRIKHIHRRDDAVLIPSIYWDYCSPRVLVMEEVRGLDFGDERLAARLTTDDRRRLATVALHTAFVEIFSEGFFHADPHPGNFIVTADLRLGLIDFGMIGVLSERQREDFLHLVSAITQQDSERMLDALWALGVTEPESHRAGVAREFDHLFFKIGDKSLEDLAAGDIVGDLMQIANRHQLQFPPQLALLLKVLAMLESAAVLVDPSFIFFAALAPEVSALLKEKTAPKQVGARIGREALEMARFFEGLPHRADRLLQRVETGDLEFATRHEGLDLVASRLTKAINRLTAVLAIALFLVAFGLYVVAVEVAGSPQPIGLNSFRVALLIGSLLLVSLTFRAWLSRKR
ncbi:MAG: AarF/ABC1/UbiB kinase family protein [Acidimicrobiia bacterium]|nr:AarF/ABC1/UbiB kinase family protein [Acidimicrobiia bacterium]